MGFQSVTDGTVRLGIRRESNASGCVRSIRDPLLDSPGALAIVILIVGSISSA